MERGTEAIEMKERNIKDMVTKSLKSTMKKTRKKTKNMSDMDLRWLVLS